MPPAPDRLQTYLKHRRKLEVGFWVLFFVGQATANSTTAWLDVLRRGSSGVQLWEVLSWEFSSNLALLALVPVLLAALNRWPLHWGLWKVHLPWHLLASLVFSVAHVLLMVAGRKLVYAAHGKAYSFGHWPTELVYEAIKDVRAYALMAVLVLAYRLFVWRWQGEASLLQPPDEATTPAMPAPPDQPEVPEPSTPPERFLVKKLGKEFLLPTHEIEWVQASGNYVNLHRLGHDYPLRATLTAMEARLGPGFLRVHRSYLVNLALVACIEPTEFGDARLQMQTGSSLPCSRSYLDALRLRLV